MEEENGRRSASDYDVPEGKEICKDWLRHVCNRHQKCKFYHPPESADDKPRQNYQFCHDHQNRMCRRDNCRFVHCSREDEDEFKKSGHVSESLARAILISGQGSNDNINGVPICKDYLVGKCDRGKRCRYWHIEEIDDDPAPPRVIRAPAAMIARRLPDLGIDPYQYAGTRSSVEPEYHRGGNRGIPPPAGDYYGAARRGGEMLEARGGGYLGGAGGGLSTAYPPMQQRMMKRPRLEEVDGAEYASDFALGVQRAGMRPASPVSYANVVEENQLLRRRVETLKKQVNDLTSANEVLLEQNARLRAKQAISTSHEQASQASIVASTMAALQYATAPSAAQAVANENALAAAAVAAVSLAQQAAARQNLSAMTMSAPSVGQPSLVSYPSSYGRAELDKFVYDAGENFDTYASRAFMQNRGETFDKGGPQI